MSLTDAVLSRARTMRPGQEVQIPASELELIGQRYRMKPAAFRQLIGASPSRFLASTAFSNGTG